MNTRRSKGPRLETREGISPKNSRIAPPSSSRRQEAPIFSTQKSMSLVTSAATRFAKTGHPVQTHSTPVRNGCNLIQPFTTKKARGGKGANPRAIKSPDNFFRRASARPQRVKATNAPGLYPAHLLPRTRCDCALRSASRNLTTLKTNHK